MFECLRIAILVTYTRSGWPRLSWFEHLYWNHREISVFLLFSRKLDRFAPNKLTELGCINYPICLNYKNGFYTVREIKDSFYQQIVLSSRRDFGQVTRHFFATSLYILYTSNFNYLIRWVIVTYILLDISVVNSHATSAYECEMLVVTWHYLPSVRLDNARSMIRPWKRRLRCLRRSACKPVLL